MGRFRDVSFWFGSTLIHFTQQNLCWGMRLHPQLYVTDYYSANLLLAVERKIVTCMIAFSDASTKWTETKANSPGSGPRSGPLSERKMQMDSYKKSINQPRWISVKKQTKKQFFSRMDHYVLCLSYHSNKEQSCLQSFEP